MDKKKHFNDAWKDWIKTNVAAGQDKDGLFKILLDEGYDYAAIKQEMRYEPTVPLAQLVNPFHVAQQLQEQVEQKTPSDNGPLFIPNAERLDSPHIELYHLDAFLNAQECEKIIALIRQKKQPSILSSHEPDQYFRTSSTCHLGNMDDALMQEIDQRICRIIGINASYSETIQGQYYEVGQEFKAHTDYFEAHEMQAHAGKMGQRTYTFMIYLNTLDTGGETAFPKIGMTFRPKMGTAVIWNSLNADGTGNAYSLHHAMPVQKGYKAVITKWFRTGSYFSNNFSFL